MPLELKISERLSNALVSASSTAVQTDELADVLTDHSGMILLAAPHEAAPVQAAEAPRPAGEPQPDGRLVVHVFTAVGLAREYATRRGLIATAEVLPYATHSWASGLHMLLRNEAAGVVIDPGSAHQTPWDPTVMGRVFAALDRPRLAGLSSICVVVRDRSIYVERLPNGDRCVFAYDDEAMALRAQENLNARALPVVLESRVTARLLLAMRDAGIERLAVNHGWPDRREYGAQDMTAMIQMAERAARSEDRAGQTPRGAEPAARHETHSAAAPSARLVPARASAGRPALAPPHEDDAASRAFFKEWQGRASGRTVDIWQFLEALGYEGTFCVPISPGSPDGFTWPQFHRVRRQPENIDTTVAHLYSSEAAARRALADRPAPQQRAVRLSGLEAFRWLFAQPDDIGEVAIDHDDADGWLGFPLFWLRDVLFPLCHDLGDLSRVPRVALSRLGQLPGARGLKPEVVRAMVQGWRGLLGVKPPSGDRLSRVEYHGRQYLPVLTDSEECAALQSIWPGGTLVPEAAGGEPPFSKWLNDAEDVAGVLVNPGSRYPFIVDHSALLVIDLWCRTNKQPACADVLDAAKSLDASGRMSLESLTSVVAEIPSYWMVVAPRADGGVSTLHVPNDPETGVLFTSEARARQYLTANRTLVQRQLVSAGATDVQVVSRVSRWFASPMALVASERANVTIDPRPDGSGGLRLDTGGMRRVLAHLDERLSPRLDGSVLEQ